VIGEALRQTKVCLGVEVVLREISAGSSELLIVRCLTDCDEREAQSQRDTARASIHGDS
jgi:hypothetical protein